MFLGRNTVPRPFFHARAKYHVTPVGFGHASFVFRVNRDYVISLASYDFFLIIKISFSINYIFLWFSFKFNKTYLNSHFSQMLGRPFTNVIIYLVLIKIELLLALIICDNYNICEKTTFISVFLVFTVTIKISII